MDDVVPLSHLGRGSTALVAQLVGRPEQVQRLEELGIRHGATIEMIDPGTPCIIRVLGSTLCFRGAQLLNVLVRPGAAP